MSGSPISFYVSDAVDGYVTVYGAGLTHAVVGDSALFTVCTKGSAAKELAVAVEGVAKATIKCHDNKVVFQIHLLIELIGGFPEFYLFSLLGWHVFCSMGTTCSR